MTTLAYTLSDSATMIRRNLRHAVRYPVLTLMVGGIPVVFLLLFVFVFGGTMGAGLGGASGSRADYADYLAPGILVLAIASAAQGTAITVAMDMTEGIIARFRTHVDRPRVRAHRARRRRGGPDDDRPGVRRGRAAARRVPSRRRRPRVAGRRSACWRWSSFALSWLSVAMGLAARSVETASNMPMPLILLPFLGSGFVPTESLPAGLAWFAEYQPFTPIIETLRGLLTGTAIGSSGVLAVAWCAAIALTGYLWARARYDRRPAR